MKTNETKFQKCHAALLRHGHTVWRLMRPSVHPQPRGGDARPSVVPAKPPVLRLNPLERITEHLHRCGLGQQVRVRFEAAGGDFVLEDEDGFVHARDFDEAVVLIEQIWLYQP
jgi:hypothetical protein